MDNQSDREFAIGEHAFNAGWDEGRQYLYARNPEGHKPNALELEARHEAFSEYTPPDDLCGGGEEIKIKLTIDSAEVAAEVNRLVHEGFLAGYRAAETRAQNFHPQKLAHNRSAAERAWSRLSIAKGSASEANVGKDDVAGD